MAWPNDLKFVLCVKFPRKYLPAIKEAIDKHEVQWRGVSTFASSCEAAFNWHGVVFNLGESYEVVQYIEYVSGEFTEKHTFEILKYN